MSVKRTAAALSLTAAAIGGGVTYGELHKDTDSPTPKSDTTFSSVEYTIPSKDTLEVAVPNSNFVIKAHKVGKKVVLGLFTGEVGDTSTFLVGQGENISTDSKPLVHKLEKSGFQPISLAVDKDYVLALNFPELMNESEYVTLKTDEHDVTHMAIQSANEELQK